MMLTEILTALTIFTIIGGILDNISSAALKKRLSLALLKTPLKRFKRQTFLEALTETKIELFDRRFGTDPFSWKFAKSSAIFSAISFAAFALIYAMYHRDVEILNFYRETQNPTNIIVLLMFLAINLVIDWISIAQTSYFLNLTLAAKRLWQIVVLAFADVLITINMFILLFPIALAAGAMLTAINQRSGTIELTFSPFTIDDRSTQSWNDFAENNQLNRDTGFKNYIRKERFIGNFTVQAESTQGHSYAYTVPVFSNRPLETPQLIAIAKKIYTDLDGFNADLAKAEHNDDITTIKMPYAGLAGATDLFSPYLYAAGYIMTDSIENGLWELRNLERFSTRFDRLIYLYTSNYAITDLSRGDATTVCFDTNELTYKLSLTELEKCKNWLVLFGDTRALSRYAFLTSEDKGSIPQGLFFLTSFSFTLMLYVVILLFSIGRLSAGSLSWMISKRSINVDKHPFVFMGMCTGIVVGLFSSAIN